MEMYKRTHIPRNHIALVDSAFDYSRSFAIRNLTRFRMTIPTNTHLATALARWVAPFLVLAGCAGSHGLAQAQTEITPPPPKPPATAASAPAPVAAPAAPAANPAAPKPFKDIIKDAKEHKGYYTLWQKDEKVWMEIRPEQLGKPFFFSGSVANAVGERGLYASFMNGSDHAEFRKIGNQVQLIAKNMAFYATPGTPQAHALAQGFSDSLLSSAPVVSAPHPDTKGVLIELNALLFNDIIGYSTNLERAFRMSFALDKANTSIAKFNVDDKLTGVLVNNHFSVPRIAAPPLTPPPTPATPPPANLPDARSLFVGVYYNFMPLPEQPMRPRMADDRIGHFVTSIDDYTDDTTVKTKRHFVNRWRLEKADPAAAMSEPNHPITFWLDKNIPEKYRKSVADGIELWNLAFEKIGFKNAIVAKQQAETDSFDTLDSRHASIRWVMGSDVSFARGPSVTDARSGEILDADIMMSDGFGRGARNQVAEELPRTIPINHVHSHKHGEECSFAHGAAFELDFALDVLEARGDGDMSSPQADALAQAYVKEVIAHEVGHTLGLRHNFRGSTVYTAAQLQDVAFTKANGTASSVMDYVPFNLAVKGEQQGEYITSTLGPYDLWAIEYAYKPLEPEQETAELARITARSTEPWLAYSTDEDSGTGALSDPAVNQFDLGSDPLAYVQKRLLISKELWDRAHKRQLKDGESYETLRRNVNSGLRQFARTVQIATKYIGGTTTLRDRAGTGRPTFTPVPAAQQRQALQMVADTLFSARNFVFTPELLSRMGMDQTTYTGAPRATLSPAAVMLTTQTAALDQLMSDTVAARVLGSVELAKNPKDVLSLNELYGTLQSSIWSELGTANDITSFRRDLQREHVKRVAQAIIKPSGATRADARSLQRQHATALLAKIRLAAGRMKSAEARAHLMESEVMLSEALKAPLMRSAI